MGILKLGVIGFFIIAPFLFISSIQMNEFKKEEEIRERVANVIREASYDASFSMKTYSSFLYDSKKEYSIRTDYDQVVETFFDSLDFRGFKYRMAEFSHLIFIDYDGVVIYLPESRTYMPKVYYTKVEGTQLTYYTLSDQSYQGSFTSLGSMIGEESKVEDIRPSQDKEIAVMTAIEKALIHSLDIQSIEDKETMSSKKFDLPKLKSSLFGTTTTDLSFVVLYESDTIVGSQPIELLSVTPSGIMKISQDAYAD